MFSTRLALSLLFLLLFGSSLSAENVVRWAETPIVLDGKADEAPWSVAQRIDGFGQPWLGNRKAEVIAPTEARLLWDRDYLYFFAELTDSDLFADIKEHDGKTWFNDAFEIFLKPRAEKPAYYEFHVTPAGTVMDMLIPERKGENLFERHVGEGKFHLQSRVVLRGTLNKSGDRDQGWSVEARLPWRDFYRTGGRPNPGDLWRFALCRYDYPSDGKPPVLSTSAPLKSKAEPDFHLTDEYSEIRFAGPVEMPSADKLIALKDYRPLQQRIVGGPDPPLPYRAVPAYADLKIEFPMTVMRIPQSDQLLVMHNTKSQLAQFPDRKDVRQIETKLEFDGTAYGIAFHPQFEENGFVYLAVNGRPQAAPGPEKKTSVYRYTMQTTSPYAIDAESKLLIIEWLSNGHNGGDVAFGNDGMLYVTSGDGTSDSDTNLTGQGLDHLLAKLLRIDVDHPEAGQAYSVPKDNPFLGLKGARPETWCYGFRNPWRLTVDRRTGHVWVAQNGQDLWEQAYLVQRGANYGWSVMEGSHPFYLNRKRGPHPIQKPTVEHSHAEARSLTGGIVYYGKRFPDLHGAYLYGDYSTGKIWGVKHDGTKVVWHRELADTPLAIAGFAEDSQGELLIVDHRKEGQLYTLEPNAVRAAGDFPRSLSATGLFASVAEHRAQPSLIPYSVNAPLWSDGAFKERFLALPAGAKINLETNRGWDLPDDTILVKSFGFEQQEGVAASRRWIETRLLIKQQNEWIGYSYAWNPEQTDAVLVEKQGRDATLEIQEGDQVLKRSWRFPSRSECMVCHSRAANYVLGLSTAQFNKMHDYGNGPVHQFHALGSLGLFDWQTQATKQIERDATAQKLEADEAAKYKQQQTTLLPGYEIAGSKIPRKSPDEYKRLVDPYDPKQDLNARARSYLHANCSICHVEAGGGNSQFDLAFTSDDERTKLFDVQPLHDRFGIQDARLVARGKPKQSVLLHRVAIRGRGQMPQLATSVVDQAAVKMLEEWIRSLEPPEEKEE